MTTQFIEIEIKNHKDKRYLSHWSRRILDNFERSGFSERQLFSDCATFNTKSRYYSVNYHLQGHVVQLIFWEK